jgi:hypothetical protein
MTYSRRTKEDEELQAIIFLHSLGFTDACCTQQYHDEAGASVECPESLPGLHLEVLDGCQCTDLDTDARKFRESLLKASDHKHWAVLWKPDRKDPDNWRLTFLADAPAVITTVDGAGDVKAVLHWMQVKRLGVTLEIK